MAKNLENLLNKINELIEKLETLQSQTLKDIADIPPDDINRLEELLNLISSVETELQKLRNLKLHNLTGENIQEEIRRVEEFYNTLAEGATASVPIDTKQIDRIKATISELLLQLNDLKRRASDKLTITQIREEDKNSLIDLVKNIDNLITRLSEAASTNIFPDNIKQQLLEWKDELNSLYETFNKLYKNIENYDVGDIRKEFKIEVDDEQIDNIKNIIEEPEDITLDFKVRSDTSQVDNLRNKLKGTRIEVSKLEETFPGITNFLKSMGVEVDKLSGKVKVSVRDIQGVLKEIRFPSGAKIFFREDINEFFTSLSSAKAALGKKQLEDIRKEFGAVISEARRAGYELKNLKRIEELSGGVKRFTFSMRDAQGYMRSMVVYADRFGNVLVEDRKKLLNFTDSIIRNTIEAAKWAFAVNVVYGSMRKLNEAIEEAIQNQERLASIAVVIGTGQESFGTIFESASRIADEIGVKTGEVLEGFTLAFRVARSEAQTTAERFQVASDIMRNALVLAKLSGEDTATAMDLLISSARQTGVSLSETSKILDRWVFLSTKAQVTTKDLAEAFAQSAAVSKTVGIGDASDIEERLKEFDILAGYIAAIAESTTYTGEEIGNILRSLFSNIQSSEVQSKLIEFGISVRDLNGELRDFDEILSEIYAKYRAGIITEAQLGEIGRIIGGGARRGPQFVTLIQNLDRATEYTSLLQNSNIQLGYSYDAVQVKTETVQANINRLSNSFQRLAATMGEEGALNALNNFVILLKHIVDFGAFVTNTLGPTGLVGTVALLSTGFRKSAYTASLFDKALRSLVTWFYKLRNAQQGVIDQKIDSVLAKSSKIASITQAALIAGISAMSQDNITSALTSGIGALIGFWAGGPFGAIIGSAFGDVIGGFVNDFINATESELAPAVSRIISNALSEGISEGVSDGIEEASAAKRIEEQILDPGTKFKGYLTSLVVDAWDWINEATFGKFEENIFPDKTTAALVTSEDYENAERYEKVMSLIVDMYRRAGAEQTKRVFGLSDEDIEAIEEYINILNLYSSVDLSANVSEQAGMLGVLRAGYNITEQDLSEIIRLQAEYRREIEQSYAAGEISYKQYSDSLEKVSRFHTVLIPLVKDLEGAIEDSGNSAIETSQLYEKMARIFVSGTEEEIKAIIALSVALREARAEAGGIETEDVRSIENQLQETIDLVYRNISRRELRLPVFMDLSNMSSEEIDLWLEEMARLQESYIKGAVEEGLVPSEEALRNYFNGIEPVFVYTKEGLLKAVGEGLDIQRFGAIARKNLEEAGLLDTSGQFQIKFLDISSKDRGKLEAALARAARTLEQFAPYYQLDPKPLGVVFKDNVTDIIHVDLLQLNLAMRELVELNRDQLDGIYNLPSDATFFVPWMAWELAAVSALNAETPTQPEEKTALDINPDEVLDRFAKISKEIGKGIIDKLTDIENKTTPPDTMAELIQKMYEPVKRMVEIAVTQPGFAGSVSNIDEGMKNLEEYYKDKYWKYTVTPYGSVWRGMDVEPKQETEPQSKLDEFLNKLENFFDGLLDIYKNTSIETTSFINPQDITEAIRSLDVRTDLNINLMQNVQLQLDGKILYAQLMNYLYRDMLSRTRTSTVARINNII